MEKSDLLQGMEEVLAIVRGEMKPGEITVYKIPDVKKIREDLKASRETFADAIGVSTETVKSWELRRRNPTGSAAKLLFAIENNPRLFQDLISQENNLVHS